MTLEIIFAPEADQQFSELLEWWDENRPAARIVLEDELHRVTALLAEQPHLGRVYERVGKRLTRHYPLRGTPYHVFYEEGAEAGELHVLAVWSMMRGKGPPLRSP